MVERGHTGGGKTQQKTVEREVVGAAAGVGVFVVRVVAAFAVAKHGLRALAQSMARELGPMNIHVAHVVVDGANAMYKDSQRHAATLAERGLLFVVDNTITSPWLFLPKSVGAGLVINSLTKTIAGHGAALGGRFHHCLRPEFKKMAICFRIPAR